MRTFLALLVYSIFLSSAYAQPAAGKTPLLTPGTYRGDVKADNGDHAFDMVVVATDKGLEVTNNFYKGNAQCRGHTPAELTTMPDGKLQLTTKILPGCERTYVLSSGTDKVVSGTFRGPRGVTYDITLTKQ